MIFTLIHKQFRLLLPLVWGIQLLSFGLLAQQQEDRYSPTALKALSIEDLMSIEVISVTRRPEKLTESASAIQVITSKEILKYGATNIPEALYLAGNLQVAQKGSHSWGVSARGFNTELANKLLVRMDGRTVYTPLFSGVFWDRQDYLLEDLDQIEVVSGPGGTLWGANAVNGVINITTKSAEETQGLYIQGAIGTEIEALAGLRYGGEINRDVHYRVYTKYSKRDESVFPDSIDANDAWDIIQGGFRMDADKGNSHFTFQGDVYNSSLGLTFGEESEVLGGNILARFIHVFADSSEVRLQTYYDYTDLDLPAEAFVVNGTELAPAGIFEDRLSTYDVDFQHHFGLGRSNSIVWGVGYRFTHDEVTNAPALGFLPENLDQNLFSVFVQDEIKVYGNLFFDPRQ
ncbi:TonB-dependent receptor plug domain-containing protein [Fulvivirga ulvae]|uniref:TonB-dependent receptor plug domain-containing protein n=1 Tax=Fulvivirga ulvae TaxID=2904245 RepID=UPI001F322657|nr:TonB-dependent receptor plug domain-containing protein [Fulvivirga ulvae]UII33180.1 TonB-dependent receptor plug domain-containing protein [Fulvivirga ulvae]